MAPQFYEVDVWTGTREVAGHTQLVIVDWEPDHAATIRHYLNQVIRQVAATNRAVVSDLREYALQAWAVYARGQRAGAKPVWWWRYQPDPAEAGRDGWWRL